MTPMKHDINELEALPWEDIIVDLTLHAERRMRRFLWQGRRGAPMPEGCRPEDIVQDAVVKFLDGTRDWNRRRYPSIKQFLVGVVDSEIEHRAQSWANKHVRMAAVLSDREQSKFESTPDGREGLESGVLHVMAEEDAARLVLAFEASVNDEPLLRQVLTCILDGHYLRRDIAKRLGVPPSEVDNARRRLQRRWSQFEAKKNARSGR